MIKSVTVTNYLGESLIMELARPEKSGFLVYSITGLGPGKADINAAESATDDGSIYNSARLPARNIVIGIKFLEKPTIEATRLLSYKYFPLKKKVTLTIETDSRRAEIEGYVESNDPGIFSSSEGTTVSIICTNPLFKAVGDGSVVSTYFYGIEPRFEFPFSNESLTSPLIEFGSFDANGEKSVFYSGDSDIGMTMHIYAYGDVGNVTITNTRTREQMTINTDRIESMTGSGLVDGDEIIICTVKRNKSVVLLRDGKTTNILNALARNSDWFTLTRGDNVFAYSAEYGSTNLRFRVDYQITYEGV